MTDISERWTGRRNGMLTVVSADRHAETFVTCACDCGGSRRLRAQVFQRTKDISCGCAKKPSPLVNSPTYHSWAGMKARCLNPRHESYKNYGGRGIAVCDRWMSFANFFADMGAKPEGLELDRIDNSKGYEPKNCRWTTRKQNIMNRRCTRTLTVDGVTKTWVDWAEQAGITRGSLKMRLQRGWPAEKAVRAQVAPGDF